MRKPEREGHSRRNRNLFHFILLVLLAVAPALAGVTVEVVSEDAGAAVLDVRVTGWSLRPVDLDGAAWAEIVLPGEAVELGAGQPALPHVARSLVIAPGTTPAVEVLDATWHEVRARIVPSKGNLPRTVDPAAVPFAFGPAYGRDALQPAALATLGRPYVLRDRRGVVLTVHPFRYNPVTGVLRVHERLRLRVRTGALAPRLREARPSRAFDALYRAHFLNEPRPAATDRRAYPPVDEQGEMLVIAHDPWIDRLAPLVAHKNARGIATTVVGVGTIGNTPEAIKEYIRQFYGAHDLAFVLLVGDGAQVASPTHRVDGKNGACDPCYAQLAGDDAYPEILVGRFSATTPDEVDTQVERTIDYETLPATAQDWFRRGTGIASAEGAGAGDEGQSDREHIGAIRQALLGDGYALVDEVYDPGATDAQVKQALEAGRGIVNYTGHGSSTSWGTTGFNVADVDALENPGRLPFIFSTACVNGDFTTVGKCFAEAWLRAEKGGRPTGAAVFYGASVNQSWAPPMEAQDEFNRLLTDPGRPYAAFGALCFAGASSMIDAYGAGGVDMFDTWNVFGDPSLRISGAVQTSGLEVTPAEGLVTAGRVGTEFTPSSKTYALRNLDDVPLGYEVRAAAGWVVVEGATGTLPPQGSAAVTVAIGPDGADLDLGVHEAAVDFVNLRNHDGDARRVVRAHVGARSDMRRFDLDADPHWTCGGEWAFGVPLGQGGSAYANPDPRAGATGAFVYGTDLAGEIDAVLGGPWHLVAGPIDLTGVHGTTLEFQRWLNLAGPPYAGAAVEVSRDGAQWVSLWTATGPVTDAAWTPQSYDVAAILDDAPAAYVRWSYTVLRRVPPGSGWNIDDVAIVGQPSTAKVTLTAMPGRLAWTAIEGVSGYDVVRGTLAALRASGGDFTVSTTRCLGDDVPGTTLDDPALPGEPPDGDGTWTLVRGVTAGGPLTWQDLAPGQVGRRDEEIDAAAAACP